jgi:hypothetical protein
MANGGERGTGDQRPPELLPGYDDDWRDPRNAQVYTVPGLQLERLLDLREYPDLNPQEYADALRVLRPHEAAAASALMMGLADDRLVSLADDLALCDAETRTARAYQAAREVLRAYYVDKRLKVEPKYLAAARIVAQCIDVEFLTHDLPQKKRELSALAKGRLTRLSPGTFNTVPFMLAGHSQDDAANLFDRDRTTLSESFNNAISGLQDRFGRYCNGPAIPPGKAIRPCYSLFEDGRNERTDQPTPALQTAELPNRDFLGPWRAEALEYWGYWGDATKLPQGLADGYLQPGIPAAMSSCSTCLL